MEEVIISAVGINHKGCVRTNNEDNLFLNGQYMKLKKMNDGCEIHMRSSHVHQVYAVCDGMGGLDAGEVASSMAVTALAKAKRQGRLRSVSGLVQELQSISQQIVAYSRQKNARTGTTLVMICVNGGKAIVSNVGDSRLYRLRDGRLEQISRDHSEVERMISMGLITPEQAMTHPRRHVITQYLGIDSGAILSPRIVENVDLQVGDRFLVCSDGVTDMLPDSVLFTLLSSSQSVSQIAKSVIDSALNAGGVDNTTAIVLRVEKVQSAQGKGNVDHSWKWWLLTALQGLLGLGILGILVDLLRKLF